MIGLILATRREAGPLLEKLAAERIADRPFEVYRFAPEAGRDGGVIVLSGIGKQRAAAATAHLISARGASRVINVGVCGALSASLEPGAMVRIAAVLDGDAEGEPLPCEHSAWGKLTAARLASVDEAVFGGARRAELARRADVVDMEGWGVAEACRRLGAAFCAVKGVTDQADGGGRERLLENIDAVSADLAEAVVAELGRPAEPSSSALVKLARFAKLEHSLHSLPLLFAGAWLGARGAWPLLWTLAWIAAAGVGARTVGMAMNRIFDRRLDAANPRTAGRALPSGRMSPAGAWGVAAAGLVLYLLACAMLGPLCLMLSPVPAALLIGYSLLKRFTALCHFGIGLCLAAAPLGAFIAASGSLLLTVEILLLAAFTFCWISGFDIIYALQDIVSDRQTGVHSIPAALGGGAAQVVAAVVHAAAVAAAAWLWWRAGQTVLSAAALAVVAIGFAVAYCPRVPLRARFFPLSAVVGVAAAMVPLLGELA